MLERTIPKELKPGPPSRPEIPEGVIPQPDTIPNTTEALDTGLMLLEQTPITEAKQDHVVDVIESIHDLIGKMTSGGYKKEDITHIIDEAFRFHTQGEIDSDLLHRLIRTIGAATAGNTEQLTEENRRLQREAYTDKLTGLGNRAAFDAFLDREEEKELIGIDLVNFKLVNDGISMEAGDRFIQAAARAVSTALSIINLSPRAGFHANHESSEEDGFRTGGDEFWAASLAEDTEELMRIIERLYYKNIEALALEDERIAAKVKFIEEDGMNVPYCEVKNSDGAVTGYKFGMRIASGKTPEEVNERLAEKKELEKLAGPKYRKF